MIAFIVLLTISSIAFAQIYNKKKREDIAFKKLFKKVSGRLLLFGGLIAFFTAVRYESIPYFSMRIWLYITLLGTIAYIGKTLHTYIKVYPTKKHSKPKKVKNVYLPSKKKK